MNTLVIYYSFTGNNEALANELRRRLGCDSLRVHELKKRTGLTIFLDLIFRRRPRISKPERDLKQYDRLVLAAPIWSGRIAMPLASFIALEKDNFREYAFISVCTGPDGQIEKIADELRWLTGKAPKAVAELKVNDLLPPERKNKIRYATNYRVKKEDFLSFNKNIDEFLQAL